MFGGACLVGVGVVLEQVMKTVAFLVGVGVALEHDQGEGKPRRRTPPRTTF